MATYRAIKGLKVPYLDTDLPSASATTEQGSIWYNSITGKLRAFVAFDTWATSAPLSTGRTGSTSFGTQTAAALVGGTKYPPTVYYANTEEYNGSGWAESGDLSAGAY